MWGGNLVPLQDSLQLNYNVFSLTKSCITLWAIKHFVYTLNTQ